MDLYLCTLLAIGGIGGIIILILLYFFFSFFDLWIQALFTQSGVGFFEIMSMFFRKVDNKPHHYRMITYAKIMSTQAGIPLSSRELESHYLAGGMCQTWSER